VAVDFDTLQGKAVTVRELGSMRRELIGIDNVESYLSERLTGCYFRARRAGFGLRLRVVS
jgi:glycyl-tRNA synthetase